LNTLRTFSSNRDSIIWEVRSYSFSKVSLRSEILSRSTAISRVTSSSDREASGCGRIGEFFHAVVLGDRAQLIERLKDG
jgi:hypothetical protein